MPLSLLCCRTFIHCGKAIRDAVAMLAPAIVAGFQRVYIIKAIPVFISLGCGYVLNSHANLETTPYPRVAFHIGILHGYYYLGSLNCPEEELSMGLVAISVSILC
jgi:hypothetical protein